MVAKRNAADPYEFIRSRFGVLSPIAKNVVESDFYAKWAAQLVSASIAGEEFARIFLPWLPIPTLAERRRIQKQFEYEWAKNFCLMADLMNGTRARDIERRLAKFKEVMTNDFPISQTPKRVVWQHECIKCYRYDTLPGMKPEEMIPLVCVFAPMNTPAFDIFPWRSFIRFMLERGFDVYLVDWGSPTSAQSHWNIESYAYEFEPQIYDRIKQITGHKEISVISWCLGAALSAINAARLPGEGVRNLITLTPPLDFSGDLTFKRMVGALDIEKVLEWNDNMMPAEMIDGGAITLRIIENTIGGLIEIYHNIDNEEYAREAWAMRTWKDRIVSMTGGFYRNLAYDLYLGNKLVREEFVCGGEVVRLGNIRANVLVPVAERDNITPPSQGERAIPLIPGAELWRMPRGHIQSVLHEKAPNEVWTPMARWLRERSRP